MLGTVGTVGADENANPFGLLPCLAHDQDGRRCGLQDRRADATEQELPQPRASAGPDKGEIVVALLDRAEDLERGMARRNERLRPEARTRELIDTFASDPFRAVLRGLRRVPSAGFCLGECEVEAGYRQDVDPDPGPVAEPLEQPRGGVRR